MEEKRAEPLHEVDTLCEVTADALESVHCYVVHREHHFYRLLSGRDSEFESRFSSDVADRQQVEEEEEEEVDGDENASARPLGINFGLNVLQWLPFGTRPHFQSLKEELVGNPESTLDAPILEQFVTCSLAKIKGTNYTLNEMMCLKVYSDTTDQQAKLRRAHWTTASLEARKAHYQWAMGLYRTHLYHAAPIPVASGKARPCRLYHGLNRLFTVSHELPVYFGPISTTIAKSVATTFCQQKGLIWLIQSSYANPLKLCVGIQMDWISGFKHEREVLLYNQCLPIQETQTFDDDTSILVNHFMHCLLSLQTVSYTHLTLPTICSV